jgi:chromosome segregation ATPase
MKINMLITMLAIVLFTACEDKEKVQMKAELEYLKTELQATHRVVETFEEVATLMDSIDASRQILRSTMVEGTSYDNYVTRMKDLNEHVKKTQLKITELENSLATTKSTASVYASNIKKLKSDLEKSNKELLALQELVDNTRRENHVLIQTITEKEELIAESNEKIKLKEVEFQKIESQVMQLMLQSKVDEAESYFARAEAVEETANRTHFAPRKKKETQREAIELYRLALLFGKEEAEERIAMLEEKL